MNRDRERGDDMELAPQSLENVVMDYCGYVDDSLAGVPLSPTLSVEEEMKEVESSTPVVIPVRNAAFVPLFTTPEVKTAADNSPQQPSITASTWAVQNEAQQFQRAMTPPPPVDDLGRLLPRHNYHPNALPKETILTKSSKLVRKKISFTVPMSNPSLEREQSPVKAIMLPNIEDFDPTAAASGWQQRQKNMSPSRLKTTQSSTSPNRTRESPTCDSPAANMETPTKQKKVSLLFSSPLMKNVSPGSSSRGNSQSPGSSEKKRSPKQPTFTLQNSPVDKNNISTVESEHVGCSPVFDDEDMQPSLQIFNSAQAPVSSDPYEMSCNVFSLRHVVPANLIDDSCTPVTPEPESPPLLLIDLARSIRSEKFPLLKNTKSSPKQQSIVEMLNTPKKKKRERPSSGEKEENTERTEGEQEPTSNLKKKQPISSKKAASDNSDRTVLNEQNHSKLVEFEATGAQHSKKKTRNSISTNELVALNSAPEKSEKKSERTSGDTSPEICELTKSGAPSNARKAQISSQSGLEALSQESVDLLAFCEKSNIGDMADGCDTSDTEAAEATHNGYQSDASSSSSSTICRRSPKTYLPEDNQSSPLQLLGATQMSSAPKAKLKRSKSRPKGLKRTKLANDSDDDITSTRIVNKKTSSATGVSKTTSNDKKAKHSSLVKRPLASIKTPSAAICISPETTCSTLSSSTASSIDPLKQTLRAKGISASVPLTISPTKSQKSKNKKSDKTLEDSVISISATQANRRKGLVDTQGMSKTTGRRKSKIITEIPVESSSVISVSLSSGLKSKQTDTSIPSVVSIPPPHRTLSPQREVQRKVAKEKKSDNLPKSGKQSKNAAGLTPPQTFNSGTPDEIIIDPSNPSVVSIPPPHNIKPSKGGKRSLLVEPSVVALIPTGGIQKKTPVTLTEARKSKEAVQLSIPPPTNFSRSGKWRSKDDTKATVLPPGVKEIQERPPVEVKSHKTALLDVQPSMLSVPRPPIAINLSENDSIMTGDTTLTSLNIPNDTSLTAVELSEPIARTKRVSRETFCVPPPLEAAVDEKISKGVVEVIDLDESPISKNTQQQATSNEGTKDIRPLLPPPLTKVADIREDTTDDETLRRSYRSGAAALREIQTLRNVSSDVDKTKRKSPNISPVKRQKGEREPEKPVTPDNGWKDVKNKQESEKSKKKKSDGRISEESKRQKEETIPSKNDDWQCSDDNSSGSSSTSTSPSPSKRKKPTSKRSTTGVHLRVSSKDFKPLFDKPPGVYFLFMN